MGEVRADIIVENSKDRVLKEDGRKRRKIRTRKVDALVDTGAVMMLLPQDLVEDLGLPIVGRRMECLDLIPDPLKRTLTPRPESPYLPTIKMKGLAPELAACS